MGEESELSKGFKEAVARWLRAKGLDVVAVTGWDEYNDKYSGCDTCGYGASETEVSIFYADSKDCAQRHVHYGLFSDLLTELLDA
jgi:hypothetical protein